MGLGPALHSDARPLKAVKALPWEAMSPKPCELRPRMHRPLPTVVLTAAEQKAKAEAEAAGAPGAPQQGPPEQGAQPPAAGSKEGPPPAPSGPGVGAAAAASPHDENAMEEDTPMTLRGQTRPAEGEDFGAPGKRARRVEAISLDDRSTAVSWAAWARRPTSRPAAWIPRWGSKGSATRWRCWRTAARTGTSRGARAGSSG
eukprot:9256416-Pyramimonas_sp.AAC.1